MSKRSALLRLAAAYGRHELRRRLPRREGPGGEAVLAQTYRQDRLLALTPNERERLPAMSACISCGLCALAAARLGSVRPADLASAYLRPYPLLAEASADISGSDSDLAAASVVCPVGVPLEEVAAMVRRLAGA